MWIRTLAGASFARTTSFTMKNFHSFFLLLKDSYKDKRFTPSRFYTLDEIVSFKAKLLMLDGKARENPHL